MSAGDGLVEMSGGVPLAGVGEEGEVVPAEAVSVWLRARRLVGEKLGYALGDQVVYSFGNMAVYALVSRYGGAREFGIYVLTQRALDVLLQLCNVFFWGPYVYNLPGTEERRRAQYLGSVTMQQVAACGVAALLMMGMRAWASTPERGMYYGVFAPLVMTSAGIVFREFTRRMYFAEMRFREAFWTDVATVVLQIAGVAWLFWTHKLTVATTLEMLSAGAIVVSLWWCAGERKKVAFSLRACRSDMVLNLKLGRWFFGSNMVFMLTSQCNPWVLSSMLGPASVGAYAICEAVVNIPRVALTSMQNMMAPMMARAQASGGKLELGRMVKRLDRMLLAGSAVFAAGIVWMGPWVARMIYHKAPVDARTILLLLALNLMAFAATLAQSYGLTAINRAGKTFYASTVGLVAQVAVLVWLVRWLHVPGAAAAMLVGTVAVALVRAVFYSREMRVA